MKLLMVLALLLPLAAHADAKPERDRIGESLYPPELIMAHQRQLALDEKQQQAMVKEIQATQARITELSWQMQGAVEQLVKLLGAAKIDEAAALAQADKVMGLERDVKRTHLTLLIRLKNLLTVAQRAKLDELRRAAP